MYKQQVRDSIREKSSHLVLFIFLLAGAAGYGFINQRIVFVSPSDMKEWVQYLSSDIMRGRANGSPEMNT